MIKQRAWFLPPTFKAQAWLQSVAFGLLARTTGSLLLPMYPILLLDVTYLPLLHHTGIICIPPLNLGIGFANILTAENFPLGDAHICLKCTGEQRILGPSQSLCRITLFHLPSLPWHEPDMCSPSDCNPQKEGCGTQSELPLNHHLNLIAKFHHLTT